MAKSDTSKKVRKASFLFFFFGVSLVYKRGLERQSIMLNRNQGKLQVNQHESKFLKSSMGCLKAHGAI